MTIRHDAAQSLSSSAGDRLRPVRIWLYVMAALVICVVAVGGITRLTGSGLSITTWKPISGIIPPLNQADWTAEFEAYKQIPQYSVLNQWMQLDDFKAIFWWEWLHRFGARFLGLAFAVPFVVFLVQKRLTRDLALPLAGLFVLGGFQGVLGWWMVSSGLSELTSVSQYRLAAHLSAAALLFLALIWVARRLQPQPTLGRVTRFNIASIAVLLVLLLTQLAAGALVAGLDAGMGYNTWPLMEGALIPAGLGALEPMWRSFFEHTLTVQFNHRMLAYAITALVAVLLVLQSRRSGLGGVHRWLLAIAGLVILQVGLGIATLLSMVRLDIAIAHQAVAFLLIGSVVAYLSDMSKPSATAIR